MKKKFLILMASLIFLFSVSFANGNTNYIPSSIRSEFNHDFSYASNVNWESINGYYKVSFEDQGKTRYAFYTADAEFMGIASYILSDNLPVSLQNALKENYNGYWITDLFHVYVNNEPAYFITLQNADQKIMLRGEENRDWSYYSVEKKN